MSAVARRARGLVACASAVLILQACGAADSAPTVTLRTVEAVLEATLPTPSKTATETAIPASATPSQLPATATPTTTPSPTPTSPPTSTPTATASPTPTNTPAPPTPTVAEGSVAITHIIYDPPVGRDAEGEIVFITNLGSAPVDMTGWTLLDIAEHTYTFPEFVLQPGATVGVHICNGEDTEEMLYWGRCSAVWNNTGDTGYLYDATGRLISTYSY